MSLLFIMAKQNSTNQCVVLYRLLAAQERYLTIDVKTFPADNHVPYVKSLLSKRNATAVAEAVPWLCNLMDRDIYYSPSLLGVLWECVDANSLYDGHLKRKILSWNSSYNVSPYPLIFPSTLAVALRLCYQTLRSRILKNTPRFVPISLAKLSA